MTEIDYDLLADKVADRLANKTSENGVPSPKTPEDTKKKRMSPTFKNAVIKMATGKLKSA